ncbi:hypothetical protein Tco_0176707 [Tanacetum coccineum]
MATPASFSGVHVPLSDRTTALFAQPSVSVHSFSYKPTSVRSLKLRSKSNYGGSVLFTTRTAGDRFGGKRSFVVRADAASSNGRDQMIRNLKMRRMVLDAPFHQVR